MQHTAGLYLHPSLLFWESVSLARSRILFHFNLLFQVSCHLKVESSKSWYKGRKMFNTKPASISKAILCCVEMSFSLLANKCTFGKLSVPIKQGNWSNITINPPPERKYLVKFISCEFYSKHTLPWLTGFYLVHGATYSTGLAGATLYQLF